MKYMAFGLMCWGTGAKIGHAMARCRHACPDAIRKKLDGRIEMDVWSTEDETAAINIHGQIVSRTPPIKVREIRYVGTQRKVRILKDWKPDEVQQVRS